LALQPPLPDDDVGLAGVETSDVAIGHADCTLRWNARAGRGWIAAQDKVGERQELRIGRLIKDGPLVAILQRDDAAIGGDVEELPFGARRRAARGEQEEETYRGGAPGSHAAELRYSTPARRMAIPTSSEP